MTHPATLAKSFDVEGIRKEFPVLEREIQGKPLVYLDNANTAQRPRQVIEAVNAYYSRYNANVHRGVHTLSEEASAAYEAVRTKAMRFLNASSLKEVVFVRGTTEAINLVAQSYGRTFLQPEDEVVITHLEHHSNIVPWQLVCGQTGANLKVAPIDEHGQVDLEAYGKLLGPRTKIVAVNHISNALGTVNPVKQMVKMAQEVGAVTMVDGAQAAPHMSIDVQDIGCDFYAISGHKMFAPTGIGALYGRMELLDQMPPYHGGGDMIRSVTFEKTIYNDLPFKFEAGTPNIAGTIGFGAAMDYLTELDMDRVATYEAEVLEYGTKLLSEQPGLRLIGTAKSKASVLSFVLDYAHPHDVGTILSHEGIAVRTGHHCAQPVMDHFDVPATIRASLAFYNTKQELDTLVQGLEKVRQLFTS